MHKRLTELEKLSEISTGILALKAMVEGGEALSGRQMALDNLARMLPMLTPTQQQFVLEEIFTPLLAADSSTEDLDVVRDTVLEDGETGEQAEGTASDYEMEFQLTLNRQGHLDIKELNREQRDRRHSQHLERVNQEQEKLKDDRINQAREKMFKRVEKSWKRIDQSLPPKRLKVELKKFIFSFNSSLGRDHPLFIEAKTQLSSLNKSH